MENKILSSINDAIKAASYLKKPESLYFIKTLVDLLADGFKAGKKVLIAGNGGSLCDAIHFAEELTGQFRGKRKALPAISLADVGHISCVANDYGYEHVFSRAVEAYGHPGDIFVALSTSGNSQNLINAVVKAKEMELVVVSFLGKTGGVLKGLSDLEWIVEGFEYSDRIQEAHMAAIHIAIEILEQKLFYEG
ncbi:MAG: D-sedoheptulose-7-phosphate isomerase [Rhabdochlamydiaceae bacterium]